MSSIQDQIFFISTQWFFFLNLIFRPSQFTRTWGFFHFVFLVKFFLTSRSQQKWFPFCLTLSLFVGIFLSLTVIVNSGIATQISYKLWLCMIFTFFLKSHIFPFMLLMGWQTSLKYKRSVLIFWMKQLLTFKKNPTVWAACIFKYLNFLEDLILECVYPSACPFWKDYKLCMPKRIPSLRRSYEIPDMLILFRIERTMFWSIYLLWCFRLTTV